MKKTAAALALLVATVAAPLAVTAPAHASRATMKATTADAQELMNQIAAYAASTGTFPTSMTPKVLDTLHVKLAKGNVVRKYHAGGHVYHFCIVNQRHGGWTTWDFNTGLVNRAPKGHACRF